MMFMIVRFEVKSKLDYYNTHILIEMFYVDNWLIFNLIYFNYIKEILNWQETSKNKW